MSGTVPACFETRNFVALLSMTNVCAVLSIRHAEEAEGRLEARTTPMRDL
jgi:hypothetical protein